MNALKLASMLNGRQYLKELSEVERKSAAENGLVVVFGASDDLMEFRGAINDELDAYDGTTAYLIDGNLLVNYCEESECPYFLEKCKEALTIEAIWDDGEYSWRYETDIPHETFEIMEDDEKYCKGIVFHTEAVTKNDQTNK